MVAKPVTPVNGGNAVPVRIVENRFHGPLSKLYEGPMNDIRHKLIEEGWYGRQVTGDYKEPTLSPKPEVKADPADAAKPAPDIRGTGPSPSLTEAQFTEVYGEPLTPVEAPTIQAPVIDAPKIEAPKVEPPANEGPRIDP